MTQETAARKDTQRLQRAIVDALEDVKAQDIAVFNTEHLSPLFERVVVASGTSNRQTKALAASVRDKVREAGFPKPRIEGEENGEWIIVDCGAAVAHIMQPAIRQYYHLEEIWGDKPVRVKFGAPRPFAQASEPEPQPMAKGAATKKKASTKTATKTAARTAASKTGGSRTAPGRNTRDTATARPAASKTAAKKAPAKKAPAKNAAAKSTPAKKAPTGSASRASAKPATKGPARRT